MLNAKINYICIVNNQSTYEQIPNGIILNALF